MKIIATIGPSTRDKGVLNEIINGGVNILRLNFSHFFEEEFKEIIVEARKINKDIIIFGDLCGNKIRVYEGIKSTYKLEVGEEVFFCSKDTYELLVENLGGIKLIPLTIESSLIEKNNIKELSIKDGTINFEIVDKNKSFLKAIVKSGGIIRGGKGCNIPNFDRANMGLSNKDKNDIKWAIENKIDILCQSYVEGCKDIIKVKKYVNTLTSNSDKLLIYSKIETPLGIANCKGIMTESDGLVIGRGDLVPECGLISAVEEEFKALKKLKAMKEKKDIIIATHVLNNMRNGEKPTLPEVESIYNFIKLGVSGFMLAGETSVSKTPINTVHFLSEIINSYAK